MERDNIVAFHFASENSQRNYYFMRYNWDLSKFRTSDSKMSHNHGYWSDLDTQRSFMESLAKALNIQDTEGWYHVTKKTIEEHGGGGLLSQYDGSPSKLLQSVYPKYLPQ